MAFDFTTPKDLQRLCYHLLLDRNLRGSDWEGGVVKNMGEAMLTLLKNTSIPEESYDATAGVFRKFYKIDEEVLRPYTSQELFEILWSSFEKSLSCQKVHHKEEFLEKCPKTHIKKCFDKLWEKESPSDALLDTLTKKTIDCFFAALTSEEIKALPKRRKTTPSTPLSKEAQYEIHEIRKLASKTFFSKLVEQFDVRNKDIIFNIEEEIQQLAIGQQLFIPAGFFSHPFSHAMVYRHQFLQHKIEQSFFS